MQKENINQRTNTRSTTDAQCPVSHRFAEQKPSQEMEFLDRESDSDYAFRLQMEEALAASLSSRSRTPHRPPSPPIVATSGVTIAVENGRNGSKPRGGSANRGFDFRKAVGEGSSKGKGKIHETATVVRTRDVDRNPNIRVGNLQNDSGYGTRVPSPVIRPQEETVRPAQSVGEGSSKVNAVAGKFNGDVLYRLYFKGLVSEEIGKGKMTDVVAGFGVAICDLRDNLLFEMKGPLVNRGTNRQEAEIKALTLGLTEASKLGIKRIAFSCDSFPIFQFVSFRPSCSSLFTLHSHNVSCSFLLFWLLLHPNRRVCSSFLCFLGVSMLLYSL